MTGRRRAAIAAWLFFIAVFAALGVWQLERRVWKLALIERVDRLVRAAPIDLPARGAVDEYRHVRVSGCWVPGAETWVRATTELGPGYWEMSALRLADGRTVFVNRGFVASPAKPGADETSAPVRLTGLVRLAEPGGSFLRPNDAAANRWNSRDVQAIAAARGIAAVAAFFVDADAVAAAQLPGAPVGGLTMIRFPNNHLVYALTWFALAIGLAVAGWRVRHGED